ncbi:MAG TPA: hypothetical protein VEY11_14545 [Pyrinomonadaceae bacterium]|nr:hypothetical protein [Pyrinomonadaceae bacterium]
MPVHIEKMTNEVTVVEGELPLTEGQVEKLVNIVLTRLEGKQREAQKRQEATRLRRGSAPPVRFGE